jgi:hypothetical protein
MNGSLLEAALGKGAFGDSREDLTAEMYETISSGGYDQFYLLGDAVQFGFSDPMWKDAFNLSRPVASAIPTAYIPGNHDTMFGGLSLYGRYLCKGGEADGACLMKHIRNGNVDIVTLDLEWGKGLFTPDERAWLENELAGVPKDHWLVVMSHTFYYSSGGYSGGWYWQDNNDTIDALVPIFEENHVDLVMSGHKHDAEVLAKNNITYVVIGAFGGMQDAERTYISPESEWYKAGAYAFADVDIRGNNATLAIRDANDTVLFRKELRNN